MYTRYNDTLTALALHFQRLGTQRMSIVIKQLLLKTLLSKATYNTYIYSNSLKKVHLKSR